MTAAAAHASSSPRPLRLALAGAVVEVRGGGDGSDAIPPHCAPFLVTGGEPRFLIQLDAKAGDERSTDILHAAGPGWQATVVLSQRRAAVSGASPAEGVEAVLRLAMPHLLPDGLLVHAALLGSGERGFLCVGASGSGKSTLARLLPEHTRGDELAVVRWDGGGWRAEAFPTPGARSGAVVLSRILFLRHAVAHQRTPLSPARAAGRLAEQVHWPTEDRQACRAAFEVVTRLAEEVPAFELGFAPHPSVWDCIVGR